MPIVGKDLTFTCFARPVFLCSVTDFVNWGMFQLLREHRTLRRAFKKLDQGNKGHLTVQDFRLALRECNIVFSNEDFYHIMTEFDRNMDGRISYDLFIKTMLNM